MDCPISQILISNYTHYESALFLEGGRSTIFEV